MESSLVRTPLPPTVSLEPGGGGLPRLTVVNALGRAEVYLHGAHVTAWQPEGHAPVLWLSAETQWDPDKPIRGGVPICFPWFGSHRTDDSAPSHGFARLRDWTLIDAHDDEKGATYLAFTLTAPGCTAVYRVTVGSSLTLALEVSNPGHDVLTFEEALHSYFSVGDDRDIEIHGLAGTDYLDKTSGSRQRNQGAEPIRFIAETDRIYLNTRAACTIDDPGLHRRIVVRKAGSNATVVWNPWIAKAKSMPDFGDDEWPAMVCVETGNVNAHAVKLAPGARHAMAATIDVAAT